MSMRSACSFGNHPPRSRDWLERENVEVGSVMADSKVDLEEKWAMNSGDLSWLDG